MLRLLLSIPIAIITLCINIIFLIPMIVYKILINHKANLFIISKKKSITVKGQKV